MKTHYQLTSHPVGSVKEIWTLSWPLMISLLSGSIMLFVDRLYLAHYSIDAMNALAVSGMTGYLTLVLPIAICEITEVFVGRFHGAGQMSKLTHPAWQMLWFSLLFWPIAACIGRLISHALYAPGSLEEQFLVAWVDKVTPSMLGSITLMGYFIARGKTRVITACTILANLINIVLAPLFIFGSVFNESMGIEGTALASACAQGVQFLFLFVLFLKENRIPCFDKALFLEMCKVGFPSSIGRVAEVLAHCAYFQIMAQAGKEALTCAACIQSVFLLIMFSIDAVAKSTTAVISNLLGANVISLITPVLRSAFKLHCIMSSIVFCLSIFGIDSLLPTILPVDTVDLLFSLKVASIAMSFFFLFDGCTWIVGGFLTSAKDTTFIFIAATLTSWLSYVIPLYFLVTYAGAGGGTGWSIIALSSLLLFSIFFIRARHLLDRLQRIQVSC